MESLAAGMGRARYALKMSQVETGESPGRELKKGRAVGADGVRPLGEEGAWRFYRDTGSRGFQSERRLSEESFEKAGSLPNTFEAFLILTFVYGNEWISEYP